MKRESAVYLRLSAMMFIQFAVWGSWAVLIAGHMGRLGFTGRQISYVFGTTAFGALIAQGLMVFATNGVGMLVGHFFSGRVHDFFALPDGGHAWAKIFFIPIAITVAAAIAFRVLFDEGAYQADSERIEQEDQAIFSAPR